MTGLDLKQFHRYVVIPALEAIQLYTPAAAQLVTGTALAESGLRYIDQVTNGEERPGPAYGPFQMERLTFNDLWRRYLPSQPDLGRRVQALAAPGLSPLEQMHGNHFLASALCRVFYWRAPGALPERGDLQGQAEYW